MSSSLEDPFRFSDGGVDFRGKLIGITDVPDPRGERMCQDAMKMLKVSFYFGKSLYHANLANFFFKTIVLNSGRHKQRIVINVSTDGIKIKDEKFSVNLTRSLSVHNQSPEFYLFRLFCTHVRCKGSHSSAGILLTVERLDLFSVLPVNHTNFMLLRLKER